MPFPPRLSHSKPHDAAPATLLHVRHRRLELEL
jgi:hypothetical protein